MKIVNLICWLIGLALICNGLFWPYLGAQITGHFRPDVSDLSDIGIGAFLAAMAIAITIYGNHQQQPEKPWKRPKELPFPHL